MSLRGIRSFRHVAVSILLLPTSLTGCGYVPELPPSLDQGTYSSAAFSSLEQAVKSTGRPVASILGLRLAQGGVYVDLGIQYSEEPSRDAMRQAHTLGWMISSEDDPTKFLVISGPDGLPVDLRPYQQPKRLFERGHFATPPTYRAGERRLIQVCMFRTRRQLPAGRYEVRFGSGWSSEELGESGHPIDYDSRMVDVVRLKQAASGVSEKFAEKSATRRVQKKSSRPSLENQSQLFGNNPFVPPPVTQVPCDGFCDLYHDELEMTWTECFNACYQILPCCSKWRPGFGA